MRLSVLISVHALERDEYLDACLGSLATQSVLADEVVLVEDGPLPNPIHQVLDKFKRILNIKQIRLAENMGLGAALHEGLAHCSGNLVARMDTDDICLPRRFKVQLARFDQDRSLDVLGSYATEINEEGKEAAVRAMPTGHDSIVGNLWANPFIHSTVMFKRERILSAGGYDPSLRRRQDYDLWFRCAVDGLRFGNVAEPLLLYRFSPGCHSKQTVRLAYQQATIGYRGASRLGLSHWKRFACFMPLFRSLLPLGVQHLTYQWLRRFDPRSKTGPAAK